MNIAFLTTEYPHPKITSAAGIATSIRNLAEALVAEGVGVSILVVNQPGSERFEENGIRFHLIGGPSYSFFSWYRYRKDLQSYINEQAEAENWDLLEAPDWTGQTALMNLSIPVVIRLHGSDAYFCKLENRRQKKRNFFLEKKAISDASAIISPSRFTADLSAGIFGIDPDKIKVIHYGISLKMFQNDQPDVFERGLILCSGTIIRKKGALELPHIFRKVLEKYPEAKLMLLGSDSPDIQTGSPSTWKIVQDMLGAAAERVVYPGRVGYDQMQQYIRQAHVCIFPTFAETLGMVTIEAMAMQKAVVNSNIGWATEIIADGESGLMAHPLDHDKYADLILAVLNDDELRQNLERGARARVEERFDIRKNVHQNIRFYNKVAGK